MNISSNKNRSQTSAWFSWRVGTSSPMLKRLFVVGLVAVSLAVWAVTAISVRVLRNEGRGGPQTAQAAPTSVTQKQLVAGSDNNGVQKQHPPAVLGASKVTAPELVINLPGRNPFEPLAAYFPAPKPKETLKTAGRENGAGQGGKSGAEVAATAAEAAAREMSFVSTLKIRGTLVKSGRTLVIIDDGVYGEGDTVGDQLVVGEIGRQASASRGRELAREFVVLKGSVREYVVEIKP